ncbi:MAG TPA: hypothetical protein VF103_15080, partial [Polyangiaceae bacterium]
MASFSLSHARSLLRTALFLTALAPLGCAGGSSGNGDDGKGPNRGGATNTGGSGGRGGSGGGKGGTSGKGGTGGGGAVPDIGDIGDDPVPERTWTIFVYGHGDHNLSYSLLSDLREMASADLGSDVNVLVLTDWDASQTIAGSDPPENYPDG